MTATIRNKTNKQFLTKLVILKGTFSDFKFFSAGIL